MKIKHIIMFAAGALIAQGASAASYLFTDFAASIPKTYTVENRDGQEIPEGYYRNIKTDNGWVHGRAGAAGFCAMSLTRGSSTDPQDNWLITPAVSIVSADAVVRWDARSMVSHLPEQYKVMLKESGSNNWVELFSTEGESDKWSTYIVPIGQYNGKDVQVAFVATTTNGYMLAIDNITVGVLKDTKLAIDNRTPHYIDSSKPAVTVEGTLYNNGGPGSWKVMLKANGEEYICDPVVDGREMKYNFDMSISEGDVLDYKLYAVDADDNSTKMVEDYVVCSAYKRLPLLDRASGIWCTNCPGMEVEVTKLEHRFGDELLALELHVTDALTNDDYIAGFDYITYVPHLIVNHKKETYTGDPESSDLWNELRKGANAGLKLEGVANADGTVSITATAEMADAVDNAADRYRIAYVMLADVHTERPLPQYVQENGAATYIDEKFYYLPSKVPASMMWYCNVPVEASTAFSGVANSLPANIEARIAYEHKYSMTYPTDSDKSNPQVLAYLLDTQTGEVLNCAIWSEKRAASVEALPSVAKSARICVVGNHIEVKDAQTVMVYDLSGNVVSRNAVSQLPRGIYIVVADGVATKVVL